MELLGNIYLPMMDGNNTIGEYNIPHKFKEKIADYLIRNGVTVQECGHWVSYESNEPYGCMGDKEWYRCSKCGKDARGRCYDDEWYSAPILSAYCTHCGAKMIPQPPKGE